MILIVIIINCEERTEIELLNITIYTNLKKKFIGFVTTYDTKRTDSMLA